MKQVFRCDYCDFIGTKEEVEEHELKCIYNYDRRSCLTCKHAKYKNLSSYECDADMNVPEGSIYEFCKLYEGREKPKYKFNSKDLFGGFFGF